MTYSGFVIIRDWVEQARLLFPNRRALANVMLILIEYALDDQEYCGDDNKIKAFLLSVKKSIDKQRARYTQLQDARTISIQRGKEKEKEKEIEIEKETSRKDEEYKKRLIERIKNNS